MLPIYLGILDSAEEESKFEKLYSLYKHTMHYVAVGILKDHHLAEDAVHNAFIRIAINLSKVGEVNCPRTKHFVVIIVRNVALTMLKEKNKTVVMESMDEVSGEHVRIEEDLFNRMEYEHVIDEILKLPDTYRDIIYLMYAEEFKLSEIAGILGISWEAAKKRVQRGKKLLLENLQKGLEDE